MRTRVPVEGVFSRRKWFHACIHVRQHTYMRVLVSSACVCRCTHVMYAKDMHECWRACMHTWIQRRHSQTNRWLMMQSMSLVRARATYPPFRNKVISHKVDIHRKLYWDTRDHHSTRWCGICADMYRKCDDMRGSNVQDPHRIKCLYVIVFFVCNHLRVVVCDACAVNVSLRYLHTCIQRTSIHTCTSSHTHTQTEIKHKLHKTKKTHAYTFTHIHIVKNLEAQNEQKAGDLLGSNEARAQTYSALKNEEKVLIRCVMCVCVCLCMIYRALKDEWKAPISLCGVCMCVCMYVCMA
jgi:hypothetical protein